jgi:microcystin-dependent protein
MSTLKVNEVRHLSNTGSANIVLESNSNINLQTTGTKALSVDGTLTVTGLTTLNGDAVFGNATTDTVSLISTISGFNNFSGFTGEIRMYAGNAAGNSPPAGWLYCNGNSIALDSTTSNESWESTSSAADHQGSTYQALFNLLKESDDWDNATGAVWGTNKVRLPDFRSRSPVGVGTGAGNAIGTGTDSVALTVRALGDKSGAQNHVLVTGEIPAHLHGATSQSAGTNNPDTVVTVFDGALTGTIPAHTHTGVVDHTHTLAHTHGVPQRTTDSQSSSTTSSTDPAITVSDPGHIHDVAVYNEWNSGPSYGIAFDNGPYAGDIDMTSSTTGISADQATHSHTHAHTHTTPASTTNSQSATTTSSDGAVTLSTQAEASVTFNDSTPALTSTLTPGGHTHTIATTNTGGGGAHNNISPLIAVNFIIKV